MHPLVRRALKIHNDDMHAMAVEAGQYLGTVRRWVKKGMTPNRSALILLQILIEKADRAKAKV